MEDDNLNHKNRNKNESLSAIFRNRNDLFTNHTHIDNGTIFRLNIVVQELKNMYDWRGGRIAISCLHWAPHETGTGSGRTV